jgi:hypothetical protein
LDCLTIKSIKNMTSKIDHYISYILIVFISVLFSSCYYETEDPGPIQEVEREFTVIDFDRLEIGDAMNINVEKGNYFEISVRGDRRNVDDLSVDKEGNTLVMRFDENRNRRHDTYITIVMPDILSANFSGASDSRISGFYDLEVFDIYLSGASVCQLDINAKELSARLSGASHLDLYGEGEYLEAKLSGASSLKAFHYDVVDAHINASGASYGSLTVADELHAVASGASVIRYRGNPVVTSEVSGASSVKQD